MKFAGYAAIFDRPDRGGDIVRKGAFTRTLQTKRDVPLLWQHKAGAVVGRIEHLSEDERGLRVIAALGDCGDARRVAELLSSRGRLGLSFGYRVRQGVEGCSHRELKELDLVEVSLVTNPMQPRARVHAIEA